MSPLPWLLDWPPRPATVLAVLVVTAFSVGSLVLFAPLTDQLTTDEVTLTVSDVEVRLNDDIEIPDTTSGGVQTCLGSGTPGDSLLVLADVTVDPPTDERHRHSDQTYRLEASLASQSGSTSKTVEGAGRTHWNVFWVTADEETLAVGDTARVVVRVRQGGDVVASTTHRVTVVEGSRTYDCDRS